ncbi:MAG TPA: FAD-binding oxidoreductase [Thermoanaerobaculia bacterium]|nr:FAD-binding oxidoreductase [Thermoanaerobaculia bacterium]
MDLIDRLRQELGSDSVLEGEEVRQRGSGWGRPEPCGALALVRPRSTEEVSLVLRSCHEMRQPVVTHGGLTGLVGGAVAGEGELVLSLERLNRIEEVDAQGRTMTVQAGVTLQAVQEHAEAEGLLFALDLGARGSCTIGGNVATNAGGNHVIRYGMTRAQVLGLEAVLADGTVISDLGKMLKNNAGYDLKQLFIGSEGTLGVVTRIVLRLWPRPRSEATALVASASFGKVVELLAEAQRRLGSDLAAFEVMWPEFYDIVTTPPARNQRPLEHGHPIYALVEALGTSPDEDRARFEAFLGEAVEAGLVEDAAVATTPPERRALWALRDSVDQLARLGPIYTFDVSLPIATMESYVAEVRERLGREWSDPKCVVFGHLGDGNLHVIAGVGESGPAVRLRVEHAVYDPLRARAGSVSAEHGIGLEKRPWLSWSRGPDEIALMRRIKVALDPKGILNPGKVLPPE